MYTTSAFLSFLTLTSLTSLTNAAPRKRPTAAPAGPSENAKAVYLLSNEVQNSVVALKVNPDGTLSPGSVHFTGGKGAAAIDDATNATAGRDVLYSQSSLKADGNVCSSPPPPVVARNPMTYNLL